MCKHKTADQFLKNLETSHFIDRTGELISQSSHFVRTTILRSVLLGHFWLAVKFSFFRQTAHRTAHVSLLCRRC